MIVVSNNTPLNYLIQIGLADVLHGLYGIVFIPEAVLTEMQQQKTPPTVKTWMANRPVWLTVKRVQAPIPLPYPLHAGEYETILLAKEENADLVIIDERDGRRAAEQEGLSVIGTLRVLYEAALRGLCDLDDAYTQLQKTNFHAPPRLYQHFLDLYKKGKN